LVAAAAASAAAVAAGAGLGSDGPPKQAAHGWQIVDVTAESGVDFRHSFGDDQFSKILEDTGSGVALIDVDGDGRLDVFLSSGHYVEGVSDPAFKDKTSSARSRLYRNLGGMKFEEATEQFGITEHGFGMGAVVGDFDGDGDDDLYVLNWGANVLYRNDIVKGADGKDVRRFTDVTAAAGVAGPEKLNGQTKWSVDGTFLDFDGDGDLDLYVANYLAFDAAFHDPNLPKEYPYEGPESYHGQQSILYRNEGNGTFKDVTSEVGMAFVDGKSMGVAVCDFDRDGDLDVFEAMDTSRNLLWCCDRRSGADAAAAVVKFVETGEHAGVAFDQNGRAMASMHGSLGDVDGDGRFDFFVPNLEAGCLFRNVSGDVPRNGPERIQFEECGAKAGLAKVLQGSGAWGSQFDDFDLDGDVDLLVVLGGAFDLKAGQHDRLFLNDGTGHFADVSEQLGASFQTPHVSRGAAFGDLDDDGDVDYVVNVKDVGSPPRVMRNDLPHAPAASAATNGATPSSGPHWLTLELVGAGRDRDAIGAVVELVAGGKRQWRQVNRAASYLSQCDARIHVGLGAGTKVESLTIHWPSGRVQKVAVDGVDREVVVQEDTAEQKR
jgi:hypothetical protein